MAVLDVGCGSGVFLEGASDRGAQTFGLDASEELIALARERVPEADLRVGDMQVLPYEDDRFDLVCGFNAFFFAADMVRALREARRVAKPGAPVVIQVWGRPERCDLTAMKQAVFPLGAPPLPDAAPPPPLWKPGVLEGIASEAGLAPQSAFDLSYAFEYPDSETLVRRMLAPVPVVEAVEAAGEARVREAILRSLAAYRTADGSYRLENEWRFLLASA
jgi:SAM-dependent methyltransferase